MTKMKFRLSSPFETQKIERPFYPPIKLNHPTFYLSLGMELHPKLGNWIENKSFRNGMGSPIFLNRDFISAHFDSAFPDSNPEYEWQCGLKLLPGESKNRKVEGVHGMNFDLGGCINKWGDGKFEKDAETLKNSKMNANAAAKPKDINNPYLSLSLECDDTFREKQI